MKLNPIFIFFIVFSFLLLTGSGRAQSGGAQLFNTGTGSYGSIGYASANQSFANHKTTQNDIVLNFNPNVTHNITPNVNPNNYNPVFIAQNTSSGTISPNNPNISAQPVITTPPTTSASPILTNPASTSSISASSLLSLQPFDPYATPYSSFGSPLLGSASYNGNSGYIGKSGIYSGNFEQFVPETYAAMRRFREATRFDYTFLPGGNKSNSFGMNEIDIRMQLGIPCRYIPSGSSGTGFFYVAPGANLVWWEGPVGPPHFSPNGFGAFVDFGMQPQFNDVFSLNAWFRLGLFSDFEHVSSEAFRYQGRFEGIFNVSQNVQISVGIIYLDRVRHKIIPTGGIIWTPRDDLVLKLIFPNPKISKRLWNSGNAEWWGYFQGDYGGGSWSIDGIGQTDYNDIRIGVGLEFETLTRVGGYLEFGGSFARELYSNNNKWAEPPNVLYIKTGFIF
ncbi:MAG: hypothetical protein LBP87_06170 [Planctomycetaceae bacterium]|jgi:hypothetical protein|nr:hypothetical protein [Planctomycetaceae bacterium]